MCLGLISAVVVIFLSTVFVPRDASKKSPAPKKNLFLPLTKKIIHFPNNQSTRWVPLQLLSVCVVWGEGERAIFVLLKISCGGAHYLLGILPCSFNAASVAFLNRTTTTYTHILCSSQDQIHWTSTTNLEGEGGLDVRLQPHLLPKIGYNIKPQLGG